MRQEFTIFNAHEPPHRKILRAAIRSPLPTVLASGNAFYRGTFPRVYVDSAPHSVANAGLTVAGWRGFNSSLRYRHISAYRLDGLDPSIRATGLDVVDLSVSKQIHHGVDFNFAIDNLNNKRYWETQNYFVSRLPDEPIDGLARIHATPGSPTGVTVGLTFHFGEK
jgi:outer membrane receptor protein involved in Fe transport